MRPYTSEDGNPSDRNRPIGSWNQLYLWANVWDSSTEREGQDASATLQWNGSAPSTLIAADAAANLEMMDNRYTYMRHPILLRYYNLSGSYLTKNDRQSQNGGWINTAVSVVPVYVWWNPYNVDMELREPEEIHGALTLANIVLNPCFADNIDFLWTSFQLKNVYGASSDAIYARGFRAIHDRQVADFGASYRKTSRLNDGTGGSESERYLFLKQEKSLFFPTIAPYTNNFKMVLHINLKIKGNMIFRTDNFAF